MHDTDSGMHLVNCWDIKLVRIGLTLKSSGPATHYMGTQMGYPPMTWEDDLMHYQPFMVNTQVSDTIMSPEMIMQLCPDFYS